MLLNNKLFPPIRLLMKSLERQITSRPKYIVLSTSYWYVKGTSNLQRHQNAINRTSSQRLIIDALWTCKYVTSRTIRPIDVIL